MALQEFGKMMLVNGNFAAFEGGNLRAVVIDGNNVVADLREAHGGNESYVSRTNDCDAHPLLLVRIILLSASRARRRHQN
jgi:hypothetical protein